MRINPSTVPGTPLPAREYNDIPGITAPESSRNISLPELEGAFSLWSRVKEFPSISDATRNPPPPKFPLLDEVTAKANPTATAASMALPPFFNISIPA